MILLALAASAAVSTQPDPSFRCDRATTHAERAICSNSTLSALDLDMARSYSAARSRLSPSARAALRADQQAFLRLREIAYERREDPVMADFGNIGDRIASRTSFLNTVRAPAGPGLVGVWANLFGTVEVRQAGDGRLIADINTVNPETARWICQVDMTAASRGNRLTGRPDGDRSVTVTLERRDGFLRVTETWPGGQDEQPGYCGHNGFVEGDYLPVSAR